MSNLALQIGDSFTTGGTVRVSGRNIAPIKYNHFIVAFEHKLSFTGWVYADGPGNITTAMASLQAAISAQANSGAVNQNVGLVITPGNTPTSHYLTGVGAIGGVRLDNFQWQDTPTHMATEAQYTVTYSATYGNTAESRAIVELRETLQATGEGGAIHVLAPQATAESVRQPVTTHSNIIVVQSGAVSSRAGYPALPAPVIATPNAKRVDLTRDAKSVIQRGLGIELFRRSYSYTFEMPSSPGVINPNVLT